MARQYQVPGGPYVDDSEDDRQYSLPGYGYLNSLSTDSGEGVGAAAGTSTALGVSLSASVGSASGTCTVLGRSGSIGAAAGTCTVSGISGGYLVTPPLKNNSGQLWDSETGMTVFFNDVATNALVETLSSQTTNASGIASLDVSGLSAATEYRVVFVMASGDEGMALLTTP